MLFCLCYGELHASSLLPFIVLQNKSLTYSISMKTKPTLSDGYFS